MSTKVILFEIRKLLANVIISKIKEEGGKRNYERLEIVKNKLRFVIVSIHHQLSSSGTES